jgi:GMP synthase (glutamine-hydrolysing)
VNQDYIHETIVVLDFGSQYTQLIARRIRELGVFSVIQPYNVAVAALKNRMIRGIILSGGPASVYSKGAPLLDKEFLNLNIPVLGICYGLQLLINMTGGRVAAGEKREYGQAILAIAVDTPLFSGMSRESVVWMSHGDKVTDPGAAFQAVASTANSKFAAVQHASAKQVYGIQFHPEVEHSREGRTLLKNFCFKICNCRGDWSAESFIEEAIKDIREKVGGEKVICGLSGGVDSSVVAILVDKAIGKNLHSIFVDTGLLRKDEANKVESVFKKNFNLNLSCIDRGELFLQRLKGVVDPEQKRKIIGHLFIEIFKDESKKIGNPGYLAQGTLYPDVIESVSVKGPSATIKSHHNVGGLPEDLPFLLLEPLKELFKDEVRAVARQLHLPEEIISRHPFPGPGLGVRIPGEITVDKVKILQEADEIYITELKRHNLYDKIWQAFAILLPVQTVGVMGDSRTYEYVVALRAVTSSDGMTADWFEMPRDVMAVISNRLINEVEGINRVVYDVSSKPPATIEWE